MSREEFEKALKDFEVQIRKRLPSMINGCLVNKGNREVEAAFDHLLNMLWKTRKELIKDLSKVARHEQKIRYFNAIYNMDSQLRSMSNKDALLKHLKFRRHRMSAPVVYDIGKGPENGDVLNIDEDGILIATREKVQPDQEVRVTVSGKKARGKALWSLLDESGRAETGVKLTEVPEDFIDEIRQHVEDKA